MKRDRDAVAGFFEDLPVAMIVLAGTMVLLLSSCLAAAHAQKEKSLNLLREDAESCVDRFLADFSRPAMNEPPPTVSFLRGMNLTEWARNRVESDSLVFALALIYPSFEVLTEFERGNPTCPASCGYSSGFLNAQMDDGSTGIVKVTVLVW